MREEESGRPRGYDVLQDDSGPDLSHGKRAHADAHRQFREARLEQTRQGLVQHEIPNHQMPHPLRPGGGYGEQGRHIVGVVLAHAPVAMAVIGEAHEVGLVHGQVQASGRGFGKQPVAGYDMVSALELSFPLEQLFIQDARNRDPGQVIVAEGIRKDSETVAFESRLPGSRGTFAGLDLSREAGHPGLLVENEVDRVGQRRAAPGRGVRGRFALTGQGERGLGPHHTAEVNCHQQSKALAKNQGRAAHQHRQRREIHYPWQAGGDLGLHAGGSEKTNPQGEQPEKHGRSSRQRGEREAGERQEQQRSQDLQTPKLIPSPNQQPEQRDRQHEVEG